MYKIGDTVLISERAYFINSKHRGNATEHASVWIITPDEEVALFQHANDKHWLEEKLGFAIKATETDKFEQLGTDIVGNKLVFAKFVNDTTPSLWHGFPFKEVVRPQFRPSKTILDNWLEMKLISSKVYRAILRCNLLS